MANNLLEMSAYIVPPTTDYLITIPEFVPNMTSVFLVKVIENSGGFSQTLVDIGSVTTDYSFVIKNGDYYIRFSTNIVDKYTAFVVRQPHEKPLNDWLTLISNSQINYQLLNNQNTAIYKYFYELFDYDDSRRIVLETAYKCNEMKVVPYLDEEFLWLKRNNKIIAVHRRELIKEELDEILAILETVRNIQTDVTNKQIDITNKWNDVKNTAAQILIWRNDTENFYNLSLLLKNQMQDLYNNYETMANNKFDDYLNLVNTSVTNLNTLINTGKTDIENLKNGAITEINSSKSTSLNEIEIAKNQAIQDIIDAAAEIIGGDFLTRGGTSYSSAKAIEDDINELKKREGGDIVRVKYSIDTFQQSEGGNIERYLKISDINGTPIQTLDKAKKYIGIIDTADTSGITLGNALVLDNGEPFQILRPGKYGGSFSQSTVNFTEFFQYGLQELYWNDKLENGSGAWSLSNSYLPFNNYTPGLFNAESFENLKNSTSFISMNMGAYTDAQIITEMNTAYLKGQDAQINMFMGGSGITPTLSTDSNGRMTFTPISTTMILKYTPKEVAGYALGSAECRVPMVWDSAKQKHVMNTSFSLRTIGNWRFSGGKQSVFSGTISKILNSTTTTQSVTATELGLSFPIITSRAVNLIGTITTERSENGTGNFPFQIRIFLSPYTKEFPIITYRTTTGTEQIAVSINSVVNVNAQLQLVFLLRTRAGTLRATGNATVKLEVVEFEYF